MADRCNSLKAGNLDKRTATLGKPVPSARKVNTRQYRMPFSDLNTNVVDLSDYFVIEQAGFAFGLGNASSFGAVAIVHVNVPNNPVYITPGTAKDIPEGFERLYLERPTEPAVPNRADKFYIFDLSDRVGGVQYGPADPRGASAGLDNYNAPAVIAVTAAPTPTPSQEVLAERANRAMATIVNVSPGLEKVYVTLDGPTAGNQDTDSAGVIAALDPGQPFSIAYTGAIYVFASAATAKVRAWELY